MDVTAAYNNAVRIIKIFLNLLALTSVYYSLRPLPWSHKFIVSVLSILWFWIGIVYHLNYFTTINPAPYAFGDRIFFRECSSSIMASLDLRSRFDFNLRDLDIWALHSSSTDCSSIRFLGMHLVMCIRTLPHSDCRARQQYSLLVCCCYRKSECLW